MKTVIHTNNSIILRDIETEEHLSYTEATKEEMMHFPLEAINYEMDCKTLVAMFLDVLTPRERIAITMRFGLDGYEEHTLKECGKYFLNQNSNQIGINRESIRVLQAKAFRKIRKKFTNFDNIRNKI